MSRRDAVANGAFVAEDGEEFDLVCGADYASERVELLEVDEEILSEILSNDGVIAFKGEPDDVAVVCTRSKTYQVTRVESSNQCLIVGPALGGEEEHSVSLLEGQVSLLLKRNRALERQVRALGGMVSDSDYVSDDPVMSPKRASGQFAFGSARDAFANRKTRPAGSSVPTSPFESDRSMSPSRRGVEARRTSNASARSISSESRSPRTSVDRTS